MFARTTRVVTPPCRHLALRAIPNKSYLPLQARRALTASALARLASSEKVHMVYEYYMTLASVHPSQ